MDLIAEKEHNVCFTGHRTLKDELVPGLIEQIDVTIIRCADSGRTNFITGGALGFDTLAAHRVLEIKKDRPEIKLYLVLPCRDQTIRWKDLVRINDYKIIKTDCCYSSLSPADIRIFCVQSMRSWRRQKNYPTWSGQCKSLWRRKRNWNSGRN